MLYLLRSNNTKTISLLWLLIIAPEDGKGVSAGILALDLLRKRGFLRSDKSHAHNSLHDPLEGTLLLFFKITSK